MVNQPKSNHEVRNIPKEIVANPHFSHNSGRLDAINLILRNFCNVHLRQGSKSQSPTNFKIKAKEKIHSRKFKARKFKAFSLIELSVVLVILGLLIIGATQGTYLVSKARIISARSANKNSPVPQIEDLNLWLETADENSLQNSSNSYLVEDGQKIRNWRSINPLLNKEITLTQINSLYQPTLKKVGIGNLPSLYFSATSSPLGNILAANFFSELNTPTFTIFIVTKPLSTRAPSSFGTLIMSRDSTINDDRKGYNIYHNNVDNWSMWNGFGANWWYTGFDMPVKLQKVTLLTFVLRRNQKEMYEMSKLKVSLVCGHTPNWVMPFEVGRSYDGEISEIIYYGRDLNDEERLSVEQYLVNKYRIRE